MDKIMMLSVLLCAAVVHFTAASNDQEIEGGCPYGWTFRSGGCYRVENKDTPKWEDAQARCRKLGARLVKITSEEENEYVVKLAKEFAPDFKKLWIGLERDCDDDTFYWQDGTNVEYSNWREGQPDNYDGQEDCVTLYLTGDQKGLWNDRSCYSYRGSISFMCQKETEECLSGWSYYDGSCYRIENDNEGWRDAVQKCAAMGAQLVKIENEKENMFLASLGKKFSKRKYLWIGMHRDCKRKFRWIDGTTPTYTNWREGQPDYWYYRENCVSMYLDSDGLRGMWNDISRVLPFSRYAAFACEKAPTP